MDISSYNQSQLVLQQICDLAKDKNCVKQLREALSTWDYKTISSVKDFKEEFDQVLDELYSLYFKEVEDVKNILTEFIHDEIYDSAFGHVKEQLVVEDVNLLNLSKQFCKCGGNPKQLGSTFYNLIPTAAVVELSVVNTKRSPRTKLHCLQTTYDYIFAEVKGALISVIAKNSDKEIDIPFIGNHEVIPILMAVIMKSKLFYGFSEIRYIQEFDGEFLKTNKELSRILEIYKTALNGILTIKNQSIMIEDKLQNSMTVCDTIRFIENQRIGETTTILNDEKQRVAGLIISATNQF